MSDFFMPLRKQDKKTGLSEYMITFVVVWFIVNRQNVLSIITDDVSIKHLAVKQLFDHTWWVWIIMVVITFVVMAVRIFLIECGAVLVIVIEQVGTKMQQRVAKEKWIERERFDDLLLETEAKTKTIDDLRAKINPLENEIARLQADVTSGNAKLDQTTTGSAHLTIEMNLMRQRNQLLERCVFYKDDSQRYAAITLLTNGHNDRIKDDFVRLGTAILNGQPLPNKTGLRNLMELNINQQYLFANDESLSRTGLLTLYQFLSENIA